MAQPSPVTATAALVLVAVVLQLAAAAAPAAAPIGREGCNTTCGDILVPYPFGIQPGCYLSGFNLTCDTSRSGSPRLLLGDGSLRVVDIFPENATIRVLHDGAMVNGGHAANITFSSFFAGGPYRVSYFNELVLFGCDMLATMSAGKIRKGDGTGNSPDVIGCASFCSGGVSDGVNEDRYNMGFCKVFYWTRDEYRMPMKLHLRPLESRNNNSNEDYIPHVSLFLAERGWLERFKRTPRYLWQSLMSLGPKHGIPLNLRWDINMHGQVLSDSFGCPPDVGRHCKSSKSKCTSDKEVFYCACNWGYGGNPYVDDGCQDIDECKDPRENGCFGLCTNTEGSFECRCPGGTVGDPTVENGCVDITNFSLAADAPELAPASIGLTGCETTCGHVHVPYPFGFGSSQCYLPGFELTCNKSRNPPRLLLDSSNGTTLQVISIDLNDSTVRVIHASTTVDVTIVGQPVDLYDKTTKIGRSIRFPEIGEAYKLSAGRNELVVFGCSVEATLHATTGGRIVSCVSKCTSSMIIGDPLHPGKEYCTGNDGCCHVRLPPGSSRPKNVTFKRIHNLKHNSQDSPLAIVAEEGQIALWHNIYNLKDWVVDREAAVVFQAVPIVLGWMVKENVSTNDALSNCSHEDGGYKKCRCKDGFFGNPFVIDGCQDIDECKNREIRKACNGRCKNLYGTYKCRRCPPGTRHDPDKDGRCVAYLTAPTIGLLAASGPALLLLAFGIPFALRKNKQRRKRLLRRKFFKQNHGQLLQQLLTHRADIAARMIIPIEELEKATNNFDQSRKLGNGGHGTVYKGILSDLHVVAIKKSNDVIKREINEFINEVAILSQINHRNVVKLFGCCLEAEVPLLVYEFVSNGTLHDHLHKGLLPWRDRLRIAGETAKAIAYLHSSISIPIIHRDIKSTNILLDDALTAKVSDFGASRYTPTDQSAATMTAVQGTIGYLDPMYYYTGQMTEMSDVYSFGVVLIELLTKQIPNAFKSDDGNGLVAQFNALFSDGNLDQILDPHVLAEGGKEVKEVADLAALCTRYRGEERPTMREVEITLEGFQPSKDRGLYNAVVETYKGNNSNRQIIRRRMVEDEESRQYSLEEEYLMSASYPR